MSDQDLRSESDQDLDREAAKRRLWLASRMGGFKALDHYRADNYQPGRAGTTIARAYNACATFDARRDNIYLHGPAGAGKTHLATIAAHRHLHAPGFGAARVLVLNPIELARQMRACDGAAAEGATIRALAETPLLVLDDLGVGKDTDYSTSLVYELANLRDQARPGGLIVTSNLSPDDLARKLGDDRLTSRLVGLCGIKNIYDLSGEQDHRIFGEEKI